VVAKRGPRRQGGATVLHGVLDREDAQGHACGDRSGGHLHAQSDGQVVIERGSARGMRRRSELRLTQESSVAP